LSFDRVLNDKLAVMDATSIVMCRDNDLPLIVFDQNQPEAIVRIVRGERLGTAVHN
jgi:uridylate kinase